MEKKEKEIYIVKGAKGDYDTYQEWIIGITFSEDTANKLKEQYDEIYFDEKETPITKKEFDDLCDKYDGEEYWDYDENEYRYDLINDPKFTKEIYDLFSFIEECEYGGYFKATIEKENVFYE